MNRFSHHRTFSDAFSSKKWFSCINSLWINDNASRVISLYCLHCFISFPFPSIIKIIQEKSKLMDRKRSCFKLLNQNVGCYWSGMMISLKYSMMINFEKRWERKKRRFSHADALKRGGNEESMSDGFIWWWNNVRIRIIVWLVISQWNERGRRKILFRELEKTGKESKRERRKRDFNNDDDFKVYL